MSVSITWSETTGGAAIVSPLDWGNIGNGDSSAVDELWISHNGVEKITACAFYIQAYTGVYAGTFDAATDYAELLAWGAADTDGFLINQNTDTGAPAYLAHKAGAGVVGTPFDLSENSIDGGGGAGATGEILVGEESMIQVKITVPAAEADAGTRQFDQCLKYTYTS